MNVTCKMIIKNKSVPSNSRIEQKYGSRKGFLLSYLYKILYHIGYYKKFEKINWAKVKRLVFVCKGNICRSAYADILAQAAGIESVSFGVDTVDGAHANDRAILVAQKFGRDLSQHRTTSFKNIVFKDSDLFVAMEPWQIAKLVAKTGGRYQCTLLGLWGEKKYPYIHDPFGSSEEYFDNCFNVIEEAVSGLVKKTGK